jgi:hypothetical protein
MTTATLPALVQQFFTDRLCAQLAASPNTIAADRDAFRLLLKFTSEQTGKPPTKLMVEQVGCSPLVLPVRGDEGARVLAAMSKDLGDAGQALRAAHRGVPQPRGNERASGCS